MFDEPMDLNQSFDTFYTTIETKNQWSRDDPAFIVLLVAFLTRKNHRLDSVKCEQFELTGFDHLVSAIVWGLAYHLGFYGIMRTIVFMILVDFLLVGSIISTMTWYIL